MKVSLSELNKEIEDLDEYVNVCVGLKTTWDKQDLKRIRRVINLLTLALEASLKGHFHKQGDTK